MKINGEDKYLIMDICDLWMEWLERKRVTHEFLYSSPRSHAEHIFYLL